MAQFRIEIGATNGFRYIGVQPPLADEELQQMPKVASPWKNLIMQTSFGKQKPDIGQPYTEIGFTTDTCPGPVVANTAARSVARGIASMLLEHGHEVVEDDVPKQIGFGYFLFGGKATRLG